MKITPFFQKAFSLIAKIFYNLFLLIPVLILFYVLFIYAKFFLVQEGNIELFKIIITGIGTTAALSGLSFRASSSCEGHNKKKLYYIQGERLFHATLYLIFALITLYGEISSYKLVNGIIKGVSVACFFLAICLISTAISILHKLLVESKLVD